MGIAKGADCKAQRIGAFLRERVRAHFEHRPTRAEIIHLLQTFAERDRFQGRMRRWPMFFAKPLLHRSEQANRLTGSFGDRFEQVGDCGFAIGASHAGVAHRRQSPSKKRTTRRRQRSTHVGDHDPRNTERLRRRFAHHRDGARTNGRAGMHVAVGVLTRQSEKSKRPGPRSDCRKRAVRHRRRARDQRAAS